MQLHKHFPNILSSLRLIAALFVPFVDHSIFIHIFWLAALTDVLDGFVARALHAETTLGTILDPIADKALAYACGYRFFANDMLSPYTLLSVFSRDLALVCFGTYLFLSGKWKRWAIQSFICGKVSTFLQVSIFSLLAFEVEVPLFLYSLTLFFALLSLAELKFREARAANI